MQTLQLQQKDRILSDQQSVMEIMGWSDMDYATFIHETGLAYLDQYAQHDQAGIDALNRSRIFWNWWKNQWAIRDAQYLTIYDNFSTENWEPLYRQMHGVDELTNSIYPNAVVLEESYAQMIGHFNKSITL